MPIPNRTDDPQITVSGQIKPTREGEMIAFQFNLALFTIVCLVNIPGEGEQRAPVYIKFKLRNPAELTRKPNDARGQHPGDKIDDV